MPSEKRLPLLDGIRGLAILMVLFHHSVVHIDVHYTSALDLIAFLFGCYGHFGVDVFFALSGFLITGILYRSRTDQRYYKNFYIRRALRILPNYYIFLLLIYAAWLIFPIPKYIAELSVVFDSLSGFWCTFLFLFNFWTFSVPFTDNILFSHLWSLAIEEQFYLSYPAILRRLNTKAMIYLLLSCQFICFGIRLWMSLNHYTEWQTRVFTPARLDALAIGGLLFFLMEKHEQILLRHRKRLILLFWVCLTGSFALTFWQGVQRSVGYTLVSLESAALIYLSLTAAPNSTLKTFFGSKLMTSFGKYSYAIYIFHPLILELLKSSIHGLLCQYLVHSWVICLGMFIVLSALSLALGWLIYNSYEKFFLSYKDVLSPQTGR